MRREMWCVVVALVCWAGECFASEPVCFQTAAGAAAQAGVRGVSGYRLESSMRDVYTGVVWAVVRSCEHPERPATVVFGGVTPLSGGYSRSSGVVGTVQRAVLLRAGALVQVVMEDGLATLEMPGVALAAAGPGDVVRVRLTPVSGEQTVEQFATGVLLSNGVVEVSAR